MLEFLAVALFAPAAAPQAVSVMPAGLENKTLTFRDAEGAHVVTFTLTEKTSKARRSMEAGKSKRLRVLHERLEGEKRVKIWEANDFVDDCPFDLKLQLVEGSIEVTDIDNDGRAEVSFAYLLSCRSDVSADVLKVLIYEGSDKYALRGERWEPGAVAEPGAELDES